MLNWKKLVGCPNRAQLNPELNKWTALDKEESVKSCRIEPEAKKRQLKAHGAGGALQGAIGKHPQSARSVQHQLLTDDVVDWELVYRMGPKGTYNVHEVGNVLRIVQYKHADGVVDAAAGDSAAEPAAPVGEPTPNGRHAGDEEEEDDNDM